MSPLVSISGLRKTMTYRLYLIILFWFFGLLSALLVLKLTPYSLMYPLFIERVSIVGMIVSLTFPFIFSYILLNRGYFYLVLPIILLKAFGYMFCFCCYSKIFGTSGWLVRSLLLFSDSIAVFLLLYYCYRYATGNRKGSFQYFRFSILALILSGCLDYYIVSPFIMMLINY